MKLSFILESACFSLTVLAAFDQNRGGASLEAPSGDLFTSVTGTFTVPDLSGSSRLSIWLGIGNSNDQKYVIGGGVVYNKTLGTFAAYFPENPIDTTSAVSVKANDSITVTASLISRDTATVVIENKTRNLTAKQKVVAPAGVDPSVLTALNADWWVQGYQVIPGELLQTPSYGTITFTNVSAMLLSGRTVNATGAGTYVLQGTSGQQFSKTTVSGNQIQVTQQTVG